MMQSNNCEDNDFNGNALASKFSQSRIDDKVTSFVMKGLRPDLFREQSNVAYVNTVL